MLFSIDTERWGYAIVHWGQSDGDHGERGFRKRYKHEIDAFKTGSQDYTRDVGVDVAKKASPLAFASVLNIFDTKQNHF